MCTLVFAWQVFERPMALVANRDEHLGRPAEGPARREWGASVVAPVDHEGGGTWIGYNEHGVLAAIANRWTGPGVEGTRSRGLLVRDALGARSAEAAARDVERSVNETDYEGFTLLLADGSTALLVEWDGRLAVRPLEPGVHVVVNVGADGDYATPDEHPEAARRRARTGERVRTALQPEPSELATEWVDRATGVLADHEVGACLHPDDEAIPERSRAPDGVGTASSSVLLSGAEWSFRYADGPPCRTPYRPVESQV